MNRTRPTLTESTVDDLGITDQDLEAAFGPAPTRAPAPRSWSTPRPPGVRVEVREKRPGRSPQEAAPLTDAELDAVLAEVLAEAAIRFRDRRLWDQARACDPELGDVPPWVVARVGLGDVFG